MYDMVLFQGLTHVRHVRLSSDDPSVTRLLSNLVIKEDSVPNSLLVKYPALTVVIRNVCL